MLKLPLLTTLILLITNSCFSQAFDLPMLAKLYETDIQKIGQAIDHNKWVNEYNIVQTENPIKLTQWRFTGTTLGKPQRTTIKVSDFGKKAPKMLIFLTQETKTTSEVDEAIKLLKLPVKNTDHARGRIHKNYYYRKYLLTLSKIENSTIVSISSLKEYLEE